LTPENSADAILLGEPAPPRFAETEANVTAQVQGTAYLHCPVVSSSGDRAVNYPSVSTR